MTKSNVIAIDGPSASGKSSIAARIGTLFHLPCVNTGSMFRAVAVAVRQAGQDPRNISEAELLPILQNMTFDYAVDADGHWDLICNGERPGAQLRDHDIALGASHVATMQSVREMLKQAQRKIAQKQFVVMEGRDIGSVIFPDAALKFFITASPEVRARRRLDQGEMPQGSTLESVAAEIAKRDEIDRTRKIAPLVPAKDAQLIDTSDMTLDEVIDLIQKQVQNVLS